MVNCSWREANESCQMQLHLSTESTEASENVTISSGRVALYWKCSIKNKNLISQNKQIYGSILWKNNANKNMAKGLFQML